MKIKNIFLLSFFFLNLTIQGQNLFIGLNAGVNFTNVNDNSFHEKKFKKGISTGISVDYFFSNNFSLSADLLYSQKGFGNYFIFGDGIGPNGLNSNERRLLYFHYDYLSIPLKFGYTIGQRFFGFGNLGLTSSYLVNARETFEGTSYDRTNVVSKFDFAGELELGSGYRIKESYFLYTSICYANSLTYLSNQNYFSGSNISNYGITISLGLKYKLQHK